ncbi:hypothetical protein TNCV_4379741 [Trichonephila clavipes]|nr:hypothetical protein TNCV_4379741 [Trichonephila clavipes]
MSSSPVPLKNRRIGGAMHVQSVESSNLLPLRLDGLFWMGRVWPELRSGLSSKTDHSHGRADVFPAALHAGTSREGRGFCSSA